MDNKQLKATLNDHLTIGRVKAAKEYTKNMYYCPHTIAGAAHEIARKHNISTSGTLSIELTVYEKVLDFETVVYVVGKGRQEANPIQDGFGFYEAYFIYEKGADDPQAIFTFYSKAFTK